MSYIYVITNDINGKQYVGKTNNSIEKRFKQHIHDAGRRRCEKRPLYSAINKYGKEHFSIKLLEECDVENSGEREQYWIKKLNTYHNGYNATYGGDGKTLFNYKKIAEDYANSNLNMKELAVKYHCCADTIKTACKEYNIPTDYDRAKYTNTMALQPIKMLDKETKEVIKIFSSVVEASCFILKQNLSITSNESSIRSSLYRSCKIPTRSAYGYYWEYLNS